MLNKEKSYPYNINTPKLIKKNRSKKKKSVKVIQKKEKRKTTKQE